MNGDYDDGYLDAEGRYTRHAKAESTVPFYPTLPCWRAPLRPGSAPKDGCDCRICQWARDRVAGDIALDIDGPVRPGTPAWGALLALAGVPA